MVSSLVNEALTSGRSIESEFEIPESEEEVGIDQFQDFPRRLVSYPPRSDVFKEFCKAKASLGGKWGNCIEYTGRKFKGCTVATGEEYFYLWADLAKEKRDRGIDESISLEYFDENVQIAQEEAEVEALLEELGISRKKRVNIRAEKVQKSQSPRLMTSTDDNKKKKLMGKGKSTCPGPLE
ncbi:hypothetical protein GIB67_025860 [Kingdonia uniflora]|uniref:Uncharacterized protein n=1 Tax=Kingdonia uniflora TaxID=39325 RepID=A0A7J7MDF4_9MAGN|nr:hypothetical protein GIB67_025860 [Kingdonia uniflora]